MLALSLQTPAGRRRIIYRGYVREKGEHGPAAAVGEYRTLQVLEAAGLAAPRPLFLDREGDVLGAPALVESFLPGRPVVMPRDFDAWTRGLAGALASVHRLNPGNADLSHLEAHDREWVLRELAEGPGPELAGNGLALGAWEALAAGVGRVLWLDPCLVHDDFYPGNVLWRRGRVSGVVDWPSAAVGDPRVDVAQCRVDIALMHGGDAADRFLAHYEAARGAPLPGLAFWDVFLALRAYRWYPVWLAGYHDLGLRHLTEADLRARVEAFLRGSLARV